MCSQRLLEPYKNMHKKTGLNMHKICLLWFVNYEERKLLLNVEKNLLKSFLQDVVLKLSRGKLVNLVKSLSLLLLLLCCLGLSSPSSFRRVVLSWNPYKDPNPNVRLQLYDSFDQQNWTLFIRLPSTETNYVVWLNNRERWFRMNSTNSITKLQSQDSNIAHLPGVIKKLNSPRDS